jgi:hypothetical protein
VEDVDDDGAVVEEELELVVPVLPSGAVVAAVAVVASPHETRPTRTAPTTRTCVTAATPELRATDWYGIPTLTPRTTRADPNGNGPQEPVASSFVHSCPWPFPPHGSGPRRCPETVQEEEPCPEVETPTRSTSRDASAGHRSAGRCRAATRLRPSASSSGVGPATHSTAHRCGRRSERVEDPSTPAERTSSCLVARVPVPA